MAGCWLYAIVTRCGTEATAISYSYYSCGTICLQPNEKARKVTRDRATKDGQDEIEGVAVLIVFQACCDCKIAEKC